MQDEERTDIILAPSVQHDMHKEEKPTENNHSTVCLVSLRLTRNSRVYTTSTPSYTTYKKPAEAKNATSTLSRPNTS